jgi:hypothetical protein
MSNAVPVHAGARNVRRRAPRRAERASSGSAPSCTRRHVPEPIALAYSPSTASEPAADSPLRRTGTVLPASAQELPR